MLNPRQKFGEAGESLAARILKRQGYQIIETNYRNQLGEIDIIAREGGSIVFVEVKARKSPNFGNPKWAVTPQKQRRISMVALYYLKTTRQSHAKARFDVVAISSLSEPPQVEIVRNAFDLLYG
jgi:putative endonuclease